MDHTSFCQQPWQPFCEGGSWNIKSSTVTGKKCISPKNHFTKMFSCAAIWGGDTHTLSSRTDNITNVHNTGIDTRRKKSSCSGTIFMLNACGFNESSMCKYSSNLCHNTYVRTIRWLLLSHYYKLFVSGYKQVDSLEVTGVVWDRWFQLPEKLLFSAFWVSGGSL